MDRFSQRLLAPLAMMPMGTAASSYALSGEHSLIVLDSATTSQRRAEGGGLDKTAFIV